jgi:hypothetical protein
MIELKVQRTATNYAYSCGATHLQLNHNTVSTDVLAALPLVGGLK